MQKTKKDKFVTENYIEEFFNTAGIKWTKYFAAKNNLQIHALNGNNLDLKSTEDLTLLDSMVQEADVFVQNFAPGATERMGFGSKDLRLKYPKLITVDISGYGDLDDTNPLKTRKAYDM